MAGESRWKREREGDKTTYLRKGRGEPILVKQELYNHHRRKGGKGGLFAFEVVKRVEGLGKIKKSQIQ